LNHQLEKKVLNYKGLLKKLADQNVQVNAKRISLRGKKGIEFLTHILPEIFKLIQQEDEQED